MIKLDQLKKELPEQYLYKYNEGYEKYRTVNRDEYEKLRKHDKSRTKKIDIGKAYLEIVKGVKTILRVADAAASDGYVVCIQFGKGRVIMDTRRAYEKRYSTW